MGCRLFAGCPLVGRLVALRDYRNAQRLRRVISLGSRDIRDGDELRYGVRLVNLDVNPLSEALLLWADVPGPNNFLLPVATTPVP